MTPRRAWPNAAKEARDRSAEEAQQIMMVLQPLIEGGSLHGRKGHPADRAGSEQCAVDPAHAGEPGRLDATDVNGRSRA
jgi:hypothetical protein